MSKRTTTTCDVCGKDISCDFHYKFSYMHYRTGRINVQHMCQDCKDKFAIFVKQETKDER